MFEVTFWKYESLFLRMLLDIYVMQFSLSRAPERRLGKKTKPSLEYGETEK